MMPDPTEPAPPGWEGLLAPGELILWQGQPDGRIVWRDILNPGTAFALAFVAIALLLVVKGPTPIANLIGVVFLIFGLYVAFGRVIYDARLRRATHYTLTDRAAFIATDLSGRKKLDRYALDPAGKATLEPGSPGSVWFAVEEKEIPGRWQGSRSEGTYIPPRTDRRKIGFRRIDEAQKVYGLIVARGGEELAGSPTPR